MSADPALGAEDRAALLRVAREAIEARLARRPEAPTPRAGALGRPCGAFVTLTERVGGALRGCVGYVEPSHALAEVVARAAVAAAFHDRRFAPVTAADLAQLAIEISVLGPPFPIPPEAVEVGRHGLIVERDGSRGLLLPQVAVEHRWDRATFLEQTCRKAGLAASAWRAQGTTLLAFTAEVFGER